MAKKIERLSAVQVTKLSKPGYYADGLGLYLQVAVGGSKSWIYRFTKGTRVNSKGLTVPKAHEMGLGSAAVFSLAEARERANVQRKIKADGLDPLAVKNERLLADSLIAAKVTTFDAAAARYIAAHAGGWRNVKHGEQWRNTLSTYASPVIGKLPVSTINTALVMRVLEPIWSTKTETAVRLRGRIEKILDWCRVQGFRTGDNPAQWRGHLDKLLPAPNKVADKANQPALPWQKMSTFMAHLRAVDGLGARALELAILTACRSGEVRGARWDEIDLDAGIWCIPGSRMKAGREHRVPLSEAAIALLEAIPRAPKQELVFLGRNGGVLSDATLLSTLKRMHASSIEEGSAGYLDPRLKRMATPHGFRSAFRDWASEGTAYPRDVSEMALAHAVADKTEAAYRRGDLLEKRRALMADWAVYCATVRSAGDVIPIREKVAV